MSYSPEATEFTIRELSRFGNHQDLVRALCEKYNMRWDEARAFIAKVAVENRESIEKRRGSKLNVLAIMFILMGAILMIAMIISPFYFIGISIAPGRFPIPYIPNALIFLTGLGLTAGGLVQLLKLN